ncbi:MAG: PD-(D/E)XK nuclease family protein, partial [Alphaproteobacteria bacterium]|nr:PD-(D/E)XK nuclease family protein [Alphaproteobacteria bacterium]
MGKTPKEKTMSEDKELKEKRSQYHKLIDSEKFDMLELTLKEPNIFRILKSSRYEIRHSNFLAWLLDPKASHGLGDTILKRFVRYVLHKAEPNNLMLHQFNFSNVKIRREWKNIDLLIVFDNAVITIENKIFSGEGKEQLKKYKKIVTSEQEFNNKEKI